MSIRAMVSVGAFALLTGLAIHARAGVEDAADALRIVGEVNQLTQQLQVAHPGVVLTAPTPIPDSSGAFLSPYKADGSLTAWAEKGMSASVGGAVGGAVGGRMAEGLASKIPFAGGFLGRKAKEKAAATGTVMAAGGWEFIKTSSDISFNTAEELAVYLQAKHAGVDPDFAKALGTAFGIYPALRTAYEPAVKAAIEAAGAAQDAASESRPADTAPPG
jgi:hypothetical protein